MHNLHSKLMKILMNVITCIITNHKRKESECHIAVNLVPFTNTDNILIYLVFGHPYGAEFVTKRVNKRVQLFASHAHSQRVHSTAANPLLIALYTKEREG